MISKTYKYVDTPKSEIMQIMQIMQIMHSGGSLVKYQI